MNRPLLQGLHSILKSLNPANSLFGKIVVWFWLTVMLLLVSAFVLIRLLQPNLDVSQPTSEQTLRLEELGQRVQNMIGRNIPIARALRRSEGRGPWRLILIDSNTGKVISNQPGSLIPPKHQLRAIEEIEQTVLIKTQSHELIGPVGLSKAETSYKLYAARLLQRGERQPLSNALTLSMLVALGSLLCLLLAWRLSKPIKELRKITKLYGEGDLSARVEALEGRKDEIGKLAKDINEMADKLSVSMQQQQMLMANVSHELRTPLTRLQLSLAMLQDDTLADKPLYIERSEQEISKMDELIGQILKLTRIESANKGLNLREQHQFAEYSLEDVMAAAIKNVRFEARANQKICELSAIPACRITLCLDLFISAFENITRNAIKFAHKQVSIDIKQSETQLVISIEDDGNGLPSAELEKLFLPFYRSSHQSISEQKGSGLGLSIAKAAINLHHGRIKACSSPKGGLLFTIVLPISDK